MAYMLCGPNCGSRRKPGTRGEDSHNMHYSIIKEEGRESDFYDSFDYLWIFFAAA